MAKGRRGMELVSFELAVHSPEARYSIMMKNGHLNKWLAVSCLVVAVGLVLIRYMHDRQYRRTVFQASTALSQDKFPEAERLYDIIVRNRPDFAEAWTSRGMAAAALGDFNVAKESYKRAFSLYCIAYTSKPEPNPLQQQVFLLVLLGRQEEAGRLLGEAVLKYPNSVQFKNMSGALPQLVADCSKMSVSDTSPDLSLEATKTYIELSDLSVVNHSDLLKLLASDTIQEQDFGRLEMVLTNVIHQAAKAGNLDALQNFRKTRDRWVLDHADSALQSADPSPKLLTIFGTMLNSKTDRLTKGRGMIGIYFLAKRLGLQPHRDLPGVPNSKEFESRPDYWVKLWTDWLSVNSDRLIKIMEEKPNTATSSEHEQQNTGKQPPSQLVLDGT